MLLEAPLCLPTEVADLTERLEALDRRGESLLIVELENFFSSRIDFEYVCAFMLCANALAMWKTGSAVTRLLALTGDVKRQPPERLFSLCNHFRSLMQGGFARIDNTSVWIDALGIRPEAEPLDLRDFRRATRVFSAARVPPSEFSALSNAEWYFGFSPQETQGAVIGHFAYEAIGSHTVQIGHGGGTINVDFEDQLLSGPYQVLASRASNSYKIRIDFTAMKSPLPGDVAARYLDMLASLISSTEL